ncbi:hypothetical protein KY284_030063 [Solanum tuberosum]|nr:hypothetical protein KY284_030063 [Solanum tuberosum]
MGDNIENSYTLKASIVSTNAMGNYYPTPNLAHQLPIKLTSTNFLFWKTQVLSMICGCGLNNYLDGRKPAPPHILDGDKPNPTYKVWVRQDQPVLSLIVVSVSESILSQLIGAKTTRGAWDKLLAAYTCGSKQLIRELKAYLHNLSHDNATIESYMQGGKAIADKLAA